MAQSVRRSFVVFLAVLVLALGPAGVNARFLATGPMSMTAAHIHGTSTATALTGTDGCCPSGPSRNCPECPVLPSCETACVVPAILADATGAARATDRGRKHAGADVMVVGTRVKPPTEPPKA